MWAVPLPWLADNRAGLGGFVRTRGCGTASEGVQEPRHELGPFDTETAISASYDLSF